MILYHGIKYYSGTEYIIPGALVECLPEKAWVSYWPTLTNKILKILKEGHAEDALSMLELAGFNHNSPEDEVETFAFLMHERPLVHFKHAGKDGVLILVTYNPASAGISPDNHVRMYVLSTES